MSALIEFDAVCKYYQMGDTTVKAADHITMKIEKGEFVAIVDIGAYQRSFQPGQVADFELFADHTRLFDQFFTDRQAALEGNFQKVFYRSGIAVQSRLSQFACQGDKAFVFAHEVRFAVQGNDGTFGGLVVEHGDHGSFGRGAVCAVGSDLLAFFAQDFDGFLKIAIGLYQRFFAVHHPGAGLLAQFVYVCSSYICHFLFRVKRLKDYSAFSSALGASWAGAASALGASAALASASSFWLLRSAKPSTTHS